MKLKELPITEMPRERLLNVGAENLTNEELLSIILRTGFKNNSVKEVSNNILSSINSINDLSSLPLILPITSKEERNKFEELISIDGFEKNLSIEVDNYISGKDYAESGFGFALLPKRYVNGTDLKSFDIDLSKKIAISYIEENLSPSAKQFLSEFK